jgi:hypothetical protein
MAVVALVVAGCGGHESPARAKPANSSGLIGVWKVDYSRAEYAAAGADFSEQQEPGNWGRFVLTIRKGGSFVAVKTDPPRGTLRGRYTTKADIITFQPAGDIDAGEVWAYRWSVYRDTLTLRKARPNRPDGSVREPTGFVVKPFKRGKT